MTAQALSISIHRLTYLLAGIVLGMWRVIAAERIVTRIAPDIEPTA